MKECLRSLSFVVVALGATCVFLSTVALWLRGKPGAIAYWIQCLLWGEFFAATQEMINLVIIQRQFGNFFFSLIVFYLNFATICFVVYRLFDRIFRTRFRADIACIFFAGIFGLQFDWFLWKDPPWSQPNLVAAVLSQGGIFVFYGMVCYMPRMYLRSGGNYATIRRHSLVYYFIVFILICYPLALFGSPGLSVHAEPLRQHPVWVVLHPLPDRDTSHRLIEVRKVRNWDGDIFLGNAGKLGKRLLRLVGKWLVVIGWKKNG